MFKHSKWLEKYGLVPKIFLALLLFVSIGGLNFLVHVKETSSYNHHLHSYNAKLNDWSRPPTYTGPEFEDWKKRKMAVSEKIKQLYSQALSKGENYSVYDYFQDWEQLLAWEDEYNIYLSSRTMGHPLEQFLKLRDQKGLINGKPEITETQMAYIKDIQQKIDLRRGEYLKPATEAEFHASLYGLGRWLVKAYLMSMVFWFLVYVIRFEERQTAQKKVKRHIHNTDRFYDDLEKRPGSLSLKDEILLCPWRFISRVILWPFHFLKYPWYESTAEMLRYNRLKAEFLRYKPTGYQLSQQEDLALRKRAKVKVKDFDKALHSISEFEIYPVSVRRSLAAAYLSLFLGVVLQPVIVFAAQHNDQVNNHFYGQIVSVQVDDQLDHVDSGPDPPDLSFTCLDQPAVVDWFDLHITNGLIIAFGEYVWQKLKELARQIEHVPRPVVCCG